jgi:hypothetical protein
LAPLPPRQAGASQLLRVSPPARPASVLRPARSRPSGNLPLATSSSGSIGTRFLTFRTGAADQAHVASMPGTTWPVNGHPPGSSRDYPPAPVSMPANLFRHVNGYNARLPDPRLTREPGLLPHRSPRQSSANAAVGGLKPPPAGRLRRADNPSSPAQHRFAKPDLNRTPFHVRDTRTNRCPSSSRHCVDTPTPKPSATPNLSVPPPRVHHGSSPKFHEIREYALQFEGGCVMT